MRQGRWIILSLATCLAGAGPAPATEGVPVPSLPDERLGIPTAPILLLTRADVCRDLKLTPEQAAAAGRAAADLWAQANVLGRKKDPATVSARKALMQAEQSWIETNLSPEQRKRLAQIELQWEGPAALVRRPAVAEALALTPEQRQKLTEAVEEREAARSIQPASHAEDKTLAVKALSTLTHDQQERWLAMMGRQFTPQLTSAARARDANATRR